tara:strand:+ start:941 stop:1606 length:666 start_codon:yes stop_codon:yes gene_type:complete
MSVVAAGIGTAINIGAGIFGASKARKEARRRARQARLLEKKLKRLEDNRQEIINPYAGVTDLSNMLSNPFANLSVATQATEIKMEQTDQALANTLDTLRATGASAGGATALAQAALQAKKGIASDIERQEVNNEQQRAAGEQRLQSQQMSEAQRIQQADVQGDLFQFEQREIRETTQLDRVANQIAALRGQEAQARRDETSAITGAIGSVAGIVGGLGGKL